jgi:5'-nucleotidase
VKRKLRILVDLDGILTDCVPYWLKILNDRHGTKVTVDDIDLWSLHKCGDLKTLTADQVYAPLSEVGFFRNMKPLDGAIENLKKLFDDGHEIIILSSPSSPVSAKEKLEWCAEHLPWLPAASVALVNIQLKKLIGADVVIDDNPDVLTDYPKAWPQAIMFGIEYKYNKHCRIGLGGSALLLGDYNDTKTAWEEIYRHIDMYSEIS